MCKLLQWVNTIFKKLAGENPFICLVYYLSLGRTRLKVAGLIALESGTESNKRNLMPNILMGTHNSFSPMMSHQKLPGRFLLVRIIPLHFSVVKILFIFNYTVFFQIKWCSLIEYINKILYLEFLSYKGFKNQFVSHEIFSQYRRNLP